MTVALRNLTGLAKPCPGKDPERLAAIDKFVKENLSEDKQAVYAKEVHGMPVSGSHQDRSAEPES